jgi:PAS domain S-box-containing protein
MQLSGSDWLEALVDENFAATVLGEAIAGGDLAAFLCDDTLAFVAVNDAACALTGYEPEELLTLSVPDLVAAPDEQLLRAARDLGTGSVWNGTWRLRGKHGRTVDVTFVSELAQIGGVDGFVFTLCWPPNSARSRRARRWSGRERRNSSAPAP